ncbi:putative siderophore biosynthesis protein, related to 2-demethylmenaquinone methyltransferase (plasmid) [Paraburkholderia caribensis MBA4]|uniref:Putative 4-hydroxy-4-methyl-2-oxoglutarate aldolase n=1 Tax=Paraburkholderia caribensis MBA4 TaxID=1323664 RepID=A0A0P0RN54_9BURK|nr:RraA family protein [Paraburkholderia caribensis]ALL70345.1 putative siderophore biosynthesis protein, related to 2-demethylmenaquinone methyltransferase [Paraburkholderia caribensis MBA4]
MNPIGWREYESAPQASPATLAALRELAVSLLSDNMARASGIVGLQAYHRPHAMAGTAVTVRTRGGDNLAIHRAFDFCRPGDVLVIDGGGELNQALMGDIMASYAESLGVQGLVIDGAIRDVGALRQREFPVYARGVTHRGPYKNGPGEINVPVTVGRMVVNPGDIIVGDEDGLLAIAPADVESVIEGARKQGAKEAAALRSIAEGRFDRSWVMPHRERMMNG